MKIIKDKDQALEVLKKSKTAQIIKYFTPELLEDPELAKIAVSKNGYNLKFLPETLINDKEIVSLAYEQNSLSLQYAGDRLKKDKDFILKTIHSNITASKNYKMLPPELQNDEKFVKKLIQKNGFILKYVPDSMKANREIVELAIKNHAYAFRHASKQLREDENLLLLALSDPENLQYTSKKLQDREDIIIYLFSQIQKQEMTSGETEAIKFASPRLRKDKKFIEKLMSFDNNVFMHCDDEVKKDPLLLAKALQNVKKIDTTDPQRLTCLGILIPLLRENSFYIKYATQEIQNNKSVVLEILKSLPSDKIKRTTVCYYPLKIRQLMGADPKGYIPNLEKAILAEKLENQLQESPIERKNKVKI